MPETSGTGRRRLLREMTQDAIEAGTYGEPASEMRTETAIRPEDVPADLVHAFKRAHLMAALDEIDPVRALLAHFLPATYKHWFAQAFGTGEEIAAREAEAANARPDDPVELCEVIMPGEHERRVRAKDAEDLHLRAMGYQQGEPLRSGLLAAARYLANRASGEQP